MESESETNNGAESGSSPSTCSTFAIFGEGRSRVAIPLSRITMVHDEGETTLLKVDIGSGNYETTRLVDMPFDDVISYLSNGAANNRGLKSER